MTLIQWDDAEECALAEWERGRLARAVAPVWVGARASRNRGRD